MNTNLPAADLSWKRSRYGFVSFWFLSFLAAWFLLRLVLLVVFKPAAVPVTDVLLALVSGLHRDVFAALMETIPLLAWMLIIPDRRFGALWHRVLFIGACLGFWFVQVFLLFAEFFFFDEFKSRFNTVAVDYLIYPKEVFINIWESYHVGIVLAFCLIASLGWLFAASRLFAQMWERPFPANPRLLHLEAAMALAAVLAPTVNLKSVQVSNDRTLNEIANNGARSFLVVAWTKSLDY